jgi:hypothetical protein
VVFSEKPEKITARKRILKDFLRMYGANCGSPPALQAAFLAQTALTSFTMMIDTKAGSTPERMDVANPPNLSMPDPVRFGQIVPSPQVIAGCF